MSKKYNLKYNESDMTYICKYITENHRMRGCIVGVKKHGEKTFNVDYSLVAPCDIPDKRFALSLALNRALTARRIRNVSNIKKLDHEIFTSFISRCKTYFKDCECLNEK